MTTHYLYIVLTKTSTALSRAIAFAKGDEYTHASIAFDEDISVMFSFGRKYATNPFIGCFRRESLEEGVFLRQRKLPGVIIRMEVTEEQYMLARNIVVNMVLDSHKYSYNYAGLIHSLLKMPVYRETRFMCSEFVYHVLNQCKALDLQKSRNLVTPQELAAVRGTIIYKGDLKQIGNGQRGTDIISENGRLNQAGGQGWGGYLQIPNASRGSNSASAV